MMADETVKSVDDLSFDELKELAKNEAELEAAGQSGEQESDEVPNEPQVFSRTIDLGDGSGVQVFEAPTLEELVDKLAKAQENATRKIRELAAKVKIEPAPETKSKLSPDEEFVLGQEMLSK